MPLKVFAIAIVLLVALSVFPCRARGAERGRAAPAAIAAQLPVAKTAATGRWEDWLSPTLDAVHEPPVRARQAASMRQQATEDSPVAPLPPSLLMGLIGIVMAAWASYWVKRHGWV